MIFSKLAATLLAMALATVPTLAEDKQFPDASETTPQLIALWQDSNSTCRGASGNDVTTWAACAARAVYGVALNERDWCFGKQEQSGAEMEWHQCEADSLRFEPFDAKAF